MEIEQSYKPSSLGNDVPSNLPSLSPLSETLWREKAKPECVDFVVILCISPKKILSLWSNHFLYFISFQENNWKTFIIINKQVLFACVILNLYLHSFNHLLFQSKILITFPKSYISNFTTIHTFLLLLVLYISFFLSITNYSSHTLFLFSPRNSLFFLYFSSF